MRSSRSFALVAATAALLAVACSSTTTTSTGSTTTQAASQATGSPGTTAAPGTTAPGRMNGTSDIVATATSAGQFKTLASALTAAGLVETLQGPGPFTVFAPTDDAFAKLPAGTLDSLLKPENKQKLTEILTYHVVKGKVPASEVVKLNGQKVETVSGASLTVQVEDQKVYLLDGAGNKVAVVKTDVEASNGVIHVIDAVLLPSA